MRIVGPQHTGSADNSLERPPSPLLQVNRSTPICAFSNIFSAFFNLLRTQILQNIKMCRNKTYRYLRIFQRAHLQEFQKMQRK